jgi:hypothetical protein
MNTLAKNNQPRNIEIEVNIITKRMLTYFENTGIPLGLALEQMFADEDLQIITPTIFNYMKKYDDSKTSKGDSLLDYLLASPYFSHMYVALFENAKKSGADVSRILRSLLSVSSFEEKLFDK